MAAMTTALKEFSQNGGTRTYTMTGHTYSSPSLCIQKRRVPVGNQTVAEDTVQVLQGTTDSNGDPLDPKVSFEVKVRRPINGQSSDVTSLLATFRDIVAGDEFANTVDTQEYLID